MHLYGIFWTGPAPRPTAPERTADLWALSTNRREALTLAAQVNAAVYVHHGPKDNWRGSWDAPTFRATASRRIR